MIRAELMEDGKTIATEGRGNADQILTEMKCLLNGLRTQIKGNEENEMEEALYLMRMNAILGSEKEEVKKDLMKIAKETKDKGLQNAIRKSMKFTEKFERASEKERKEYAKVVIGKMSDLIKEMKQMEKPDPEQEDRATQAEDELKRRIEKE